MTHGVSGVASSPCRCRRPSSEHAGVARKTSDVFRRTRGPGHARNYVSSRRSLAKNPARYCVILFIISEGTDFVFYENLSCEIRVGNVIVLTLLV